jgi:HSP20 family protein
MFAELADSAGMRDAQWMRRRRRRQSPSDGTSNTQITGGELMLPSLIVRRGTTPFDALWDMRREMERMMNGLTTETPTTSWYMPAEVLETENEIRFEVEVPGLRPEDINLTVENGVLTISGERKWENEEGREKGDYHVFERRYGRFERSFAVPQRVNTSRIEASYENGILKVVLPKMEEAKPRRIEIKSMDPHRIEASS